MCIWNEITYFMKQKVCARCMSLCIVMIDSKSKSSFCVDYKSFKNSEHVSLCCVTCAMLEQLIPRFLHLSRYAMVWKRQVIVEVHTRNGSSRGCWEAVLNHPMLFQKKDICSQVSSYFPSFGSSSCLVHSLVSKHHFCNGGRTVQQWWPLIQCQGLPIFLRQPKITDTCTNGT